MIDTKLSEKSLPKKILSQQRILICRPEPSASTLAEVLRSLGAECKTLPTLSIQKITPNPLAKHYLMDLDRYQQIIVVSQHAASIALDKIDTYWPQLPIEQNWFAIGRKTRQLLTDGGVTVYEQKGDLTTEELLNHPALKRIKDQNILILKGEGGRSTLQQTLENRGAKVDSLSLYVRQCPKYSPDILKESIVHFSPHYIITLSGETLLNLISLCKQVNIELNDYHFIVPSTRVANIAFDEDLKLTHISQNLMPIDIIRCITKASKVIRSQNRNNCD